MSTATAPKSTKKLKQEVTNILLSQGYSVTEDSFSLKRKGRQAKRSIHEISRAERINNNIDFIESFLPTAREHLLNSKELDITKIKPRLIEVEADTDTKMWNLFRWWNLTWWSLPYEKAYGRQIRFVVWDDCHSAPIGLILLQSPILKWSVRDDYLGIKHEERDYWVNQSMSAQRLGALPPYNKYLGGKLVASLMTSDFVRETFRKKYKGYKTILMKREIPANLLFITTTGAYGKSSVYNRLKFHNDYICRHIGDTFGTGSFHIPNTLYEKFVEYLEDNGQKAGRSFGNGPSVKMKIIKRTMDLLGFKNGAEHGIKRALYLFPFAKNLINVIDKHKRPLWFHRDIDELTQFWKDRWASKRLDDDQRGKVFFSKARYINKLNRDLENCKSLVEKHLL